MQESCGVLRMLLKGKFALCPKFQEIFSLTVHLPFSNSTFYFKNIFQGAYACNRPVAILPGILRCIIKHISTKMQLVKWEPLPLFIHLPFIQKHVYLPRGICNSVLNYLSLLVEPYSLTKVLGNNAIYKVAWGSWLNLVLILLPYSHINWSQHLFAKFVKDMQCVWMIGEIK